MWLVDTIRRYGRITRAELTECWERSSFSDGKTLSRRTFYNHRDAIEKLFNLRIECDPATYEYYIADDNASGDSVANWLLDSISLGDVLSSSREVSDRIFVENVPSAREYLGTIIDALRNNNPVRFDYHAFNRSLPTAGVVLEPYFVKLFRQRWYVVGRNVADGRLKTYALDRMRGTTALTDTFEPDPDFDAAAYLRDSFGIFSSQGKVHKVVIKVDPWKAKYLAALPLHHSQQQTVSDKFSLFTYHLHITDDFVQELLSHGATITVLEPPELRARMVDELTKTLQNY